MELLVMTIGAVTWFFSSPPVHTIPFSADTAFETSGDRAWKGHNAANEDLPTYDEIFAAADATEAQIRASIKATDQNLAKYRKVERVIRGATYEGGMELQAWYDGDVLRKVLLIQSGETWADNTSYYFAGPKPIAAIGKAESYGGVLVSRYADVRSRANTERLFLDADVDKNIDPEASDLSLIKLALTDGRDEVFVHESKDGWGRSAGPSPFERLREKLLISRAAARAARANSK